MDARLAAERRVGVEREGVALAQRRRRRTANSPTRSFGPCKSTRTPIGRSNCSSSERIIATCSRIASCEAWLMLMRKTSAPASNSAATRRPIGRGRAERGDDLDAAAAADQSVLSIDLRPTSRRASDERGSSPRGMTSGGRSRVARIGQLHGPILGVLAGVDLEEAGAVDSRARNNPARPSTLNSRSLVHMKALPFHSPPRSSIA